MPTPRGGYRNKASEKIPSVSKIKDRYMDSSALMHWIFQQGQLHPDLSTRWELPKTAIDIGTCAHAMVEMHINGVPRQEIDLFCQDSLLDEGMIARAQMSFKAYLDWARNFAVEIHSQEIQMVSEKYQYGGTPDAIGTIGGQTVLLDWKTSKRLYPDMLLQLAAYGQLWNENNPDNPITGGYHLLVFSKETGDFHHHFFADLSLELKQFLAYRECFERDKLINKRAA